MKLNWGTGIAIFYVFFVLLLMVALVQSKKIQRSMVTENYYEQGLKYKQKFDRIKNSSQLSEKVKIAQNTETGMIDITFPSDLGQIGGEVLFYRPSSKGLDVKMPIKDLNNGVLNIASKPFVKGNWAVQVDWEASGKKYFDKANLYLN